MAARALLAGLVLFGYLAATIGTATAVARLREAWRPSLVLGLLNAALPFWLVAWGETAHRLRLGGDRPGDRADLLAADRASLPAARADRPGEGRRCLPRARRRGLRRRRRARGRVRGRSPARSRSCSPPSSTPRPASTVSSACTGTVSGPVLATGSMLAGGVMLLPLALARASHVDAHARARSARCSSWRCSARRFAQLILFHVIGSVRSPSPEPRHLSPARLRARLRRAAARRADQRRLPDRARADPARGRARLGHAPATAPARGLGGAPRPLDRGCGMPSWAGSRA